MRLLRRLGTSMAFRVKVSRSAKADADDAYEWMKLQYSEAQATRWFNGLVYAVDSLAEFPRRCPLAPESTDLGIELRQLLYGKHSATYRIAFSIVQSSDTGDDIVRVFRIWHGSRDKIKSGDLVGD
jgi:plasmid stabilization system protein ParE